jgi:hypothetical protein
MGRLKNLVGSWLWPRWRRWQVVGVVEAADEAPAALSRRRAILVGSRDYPKWLVFDCPCGTCHRIMLNLDRHRWPAWSLTEAKGITLQPSVDALTGARRCHFFMRNGRIEWIPNSREQR